MPPNAAEPQRSAEVPETLTPPPEYEPTPEPPVQKPTPPPQNEPRITGVFRVTGTKQQIIALRDFMRENQIEFQIVK